MVGMLEVIKFIWLFLLCFIMLYTVVGLVLVIFYYEFNYYTYEKFNTFVEFSNIDIKDEYGRHIPVTNSKHAEYILYRWYKFNWFVFFKLFYAVVIKKSHKILNKTNKDIYENDSTNRKNDEDDE